MKKVKIVSILIVLFVIIWIINNHNYNDIHHKQSRIVNDYYNEDVGLMLPDDFFTENGQLFLAEDIIIKAKHNQLTDVDNKNFVKLMENTRISEGLFYRRKNEENCRSMSHDNLTGIMMASFTLKLNYHKEIFNYLKDNNFIYDNCKQRNRMFFHPAQYYPWAVVNDNIIIEFLTLPFYTINLLYGNIFSNYYSTSIKLLYFVELETIKETNIINYTLYNIYKFIMKMRYGDNYLEKLTAIYFHQDPNYPVRKQARHYQVEK